MTECSGNVLPKDCCYEGNSMIDGELYEAHERHQRHPLRFHLKAPEPNYVCNGCKMPGNMNPYFECPYENCTFYLHQLCYKLEPDDPPYQHILLPKCVLKFHHTPPHVSDHGGDFPYCDACGEDIKGFRYRCCDPVNHSPGNHDLHPICCHRNLKTNIMNSNTELELKDKVKSRCQVCKNKYPVEACKRFTGWKWVSGKRKYWGFPHCFTGTKICIHLKCATGAGQIK